MSVSTTQPALVAPGELTAFSASVGWLNDFCHLAKPRISVMVLITVAVGYLLASEGNWVLEPLLRAWLGITLASLGSSALNQWVEQTTDARMRRTKDRPIPSGRMSSRQVLAIGLLSSVVGVAWLCWTVNFTTGWLTALTVVLYVGAYTPLKRYTSLCTAIGAIPGALPPVLGWVAAGGSLNEAALALFAILFVWQFPHFLAIAWLYREEYTAAGLRMLPAGIPLPRVTGLLATGYALGLLPVSWLPVYWGLAGQAYGLVAVVLGLLYIGAAMAFAWNETRTTARRLLLVSLVYLPVLLGMLTFDHWRLLK